MAKVAKRTVASVDEGVGQPYAPTLPAGPAGELSGSSDLMPLLGPAMPWPVPSAGGREKHTHVCLPGGWHQHTEGSPVSETQSQQSVGTSVVPPSRGRTAAESHNSTDGLTSVPLGSAGTERPQGPRHNEECGEGPGEAEAGVSQEDRCHPPQSSLTPGWWQGCPANREEVTRKRGVVAWTRMGRWQEGRDLDAEPAGTFREPGRGGGWGAAVCWASVGGPWDARLGAVSRRSQGGPEGLPRPRSPPPRPRRAPCPVGLSHIV